MADGSGAEVRSRPTPPVGVEVWGRDHWRVFEYLARCCARGVAPDARRMRTHAGLHPALAAPGCAYVGAEFVGEAAPTRLREGSVSPHDDWSCIDDAVRAGLAEGVEGTAGAYRLTAAGEAAAAALRAHRLRGGFFASFRWG